MRTNVLKTVLFCGLLAFTSDGFAQKEGRIKVEGDDYELKVKADKKDYKLKEKGKMPVAKTEERVITTTTVKTGETTTMVKPGCAPKTENTVAAAPKKKSCVCKNRSTARVAHRNPVHRKVAYKPKPKPVVVASAPIVVHDTVFVTRVDTVLTVASAACEKTKIRDDYKKMKVKKEDDKIVVEKEYENNVKIKKEFDNEEDFYTYMEWVNY